MRFCSPRFSAGPSNFQSLPWKEALWGRGYFGRPVNCALWAPSTAGFSAVPSRRLYPVVWLEERRSAVSSSSLSLWPCCRLTLCPWASHFLSRASPVPPNEIRGSAPRWAENVKHFVMQTSCYCFLSFAVRCNNFTS